MGRQDSETETLLPMRRGGFFGGPTHALRADGFDASEDGTGRETPLVAIPILEAGARTGKSTDDPRAGMGVGRDGDPMFTLQAGKEHAVAFSSKDHGGDAGELSPTLRACGHSGSHANGGGPPAIAFQTRIARNGRGQPKEITDALTSCEGGTHADSKPHVAGAFGVRRLTPDECELLMGWPPGHTAGFSDSVRYKMCGNGVVGTVAEWLARRIVKFASR